MRRCVTDGYICEPGRGRATKLEKVTDFLRQHVGGEKFVTLVKKEVYRINFSNKQRRRATATQW